MKRNEHQPSDSPDNPEQLFYANSAMCDIVDDYFRISYVDVIDLAGQLVRLRPDGVDYWPAIEQADGTYLLGVLSDGTAIPGSVAGVIDWIFQRQSDVGSSPMACFPGLEGWKATGEPSTTSNASDRSIRFGMNDETVVITSTGQALIDADAQDWLRAQPGADPVPDTSALKVAAVSRAATVGSTQPLRGASDSLRSKAIAYGFAGENFPGGLDFNDGSELRYVPCMSVSPSDGQSVLLCPIGGGTASHLWLERNQFVVFGCPRGELFHGRGIMGGIGAITGKSGFQHYVSHWIAVAEHSGETTATSPESNPRVVKLHSVCTVGSHGDVQIRVSLVAAPAPT
jgi:hypothetical protein